MKEVREEESGQIWELCCKRSLMPWLGCNPKCLSSAGLNELSFLCMFTLEYREHNPNSESLYKVGNGDEGNIIYGVRSY